MPLLSRFYVTMTLLFLLISVRSFSQWKIEDVNDPFDGRYNYAYCVGKGDNFPYKTPLILITNRQKDEMSIIVSNAGYFQDNADFDAKIVLEPEKIIYTIDKYYISTSSETVSFLSFIDVNGLGISSYELAMKMKSNSRMILRINDKFQSNDCVFTLSGSSKAINEVVPNLKELASIMKQHNLDKKIEDEIERKKVLVIESIKVKRESIVDSILAFTKDTFQIQNSSFIVLQRVVYRDFKVGIYSNDNGYGSGNIDRLRSISISKIKREDADEQLNKFGRVYLYYNFVDKKNVKIDEDYFIEKSSIMVEKLLAN